MLKYVLAGVLTLLGFETWAQETIESARNKEGQEVTVSGIVTSGGELGLIRYFQDETAGLSAYGNLGESLQRGDSITISGTLKDYNNLLEIDPISAVSVHSSGHSLPEPKVLTVDQIGESFESQLVRLNDVQFVSPSGTFNGDTNYTLTDGNRTFVIRINRNAGSIVGQQIPTGTFDLIAICSQFSYKSNDVTTGYQLLPRDMDDFIFTGSVNILSPVTVQDISKNSVTLSWTTDSETTSEVVYGVTPNASEWSDISSGTSTPVNGEYLQEVTIRGLQPGTIVYALPYSYHASDTAFAPQAAYATESNSTGVVKVYFNSEVDTNYAIYHPAQNIGSALDDTLVAYLDRATESIDFAIYSFINISSASIPDALTRAKNRGLRVRVIACGTNQNSGLNSLSEQIPVLVAPNENNRDGIMHNKFAVIDAESDNPDLPVVWSGSTNISYNQIVSDANNMIFIQDQALARAYQLEFEEMWGGSNDQPNVTGAKFGSDKTDNTPHEFVIGGKRVESYFSPSDGTNQQIIDAIQKAENNLNVGTMLITRTDIAIAISDTKERGVAVNVLTEGDSNTGTVNSILNDALGSTGFVFDVEYGIFHHKYAVIDNNQPELDPVVITGSHNWSSAANDNNDENTLIFHCENIANQYYQNFAARFKANNGKLLTPVDELGLPEVLVYPNPASEMLFVNHNENAATLRLYSGSGQQLKEMAVEKTQQTSLNISGLLPGFYLLQITFENGSSTTHKIIRK